MYSCVTLLPEMSSVYPAAQGYPGRPHLGVSGGHPFKSSAKVVRFTCTQACKSGSELENI